MNNVIEVIQNLDFWDLWNWVINFYPIEFFGYKIPILFLIAGIMVLSAIIGATIKSLIKVIGIVVIIYIISVVLGMI